jgi:hypothetical protein
MRSAAREYWFELLIGALAIAAILELALGRNSPGAPSTTLWFAVPAVALLVLPLFARRRLPFAAPAAYWILATALTFIDGLLIPFMISLFPIGMASAFLLGNLRDDRNAGTGLAIVLGGIRPSSTTSPATWPPSSSSSRRLCNQLGGRFCPTLACRAGRGGGDARDT